MVAQRLPPYIFAFWIDERHVFRVGSLDGRPSAFRIPFGKDLVQVAVEQLLGLWHAMSPFVVMRPRTGVANIRYLTAPGDALKPCGSSRSGTRRPGWDESVARRTRSGPWTRRRFGRGGGLRRSNRRGVPGLLRRSRGPRPGRRLRRRPLG